MPSLRRRLLAWLLPPLLLVAIAAAGGAYVFLERRLTAAYDLDLGDIARALLPYLRSTAGHVVTSRSTWDRMPRGPRRIWGA